MSEQGGVVIKAGENTYFIRDEILAACKVADDEMETVEQMLEEQDDVGGFAYSFSAPVRYGNASTKIQTAPLMTGGPGGLNIDLGSMSTIMCCW